MDRLYHHILGQTEAISRQYGLLGSTIPTTEEKREQRIGVSRRCIAIDRHPTHQRLRERIRRGLPQRKPEALLEALRIVHLPRGVAQAGIRRVPLTEREEVIEAVYHT